jgi:hypothetical protein
MSEAELLEEAVAAAEGHLRHARQLARPVALHAERAAKVSGPRCNRMRFWVAQAVWLSVLCSASCCPTPPAVALADAGGGNGGGLDGTIPATEWCSEMRARATLPKVSTASPAARPGTAAASLTVHPHLSVSEEGG